MTRVGATLERTSRLDATNSQIPNDTELREIYKNWCSNQGVQFEEPRLEIFSYNYLLAANHAKKSGQESQVFDLNEFADLTPGEFQYLRQTGGKRSDILPMKPDSTPTANDSSNTSQPPAFSFNQQPPATVAQPSTPPTPAASSTPAADPMSYMSSLSSTQTNQVQASSPPSQPVTPAPASDSSSYMNSISSGRTSEAASPPPLTPPPETPPQQSSVPFPQAPAPAQASAQQAFPASSQGQDFPQFKPQQAFPASPFPASSQAQGSPQFTPQQPFPASSQAQGLPQSPPQQPFPASSQAQGLPQFKPQQPFPASSQAQGSPQFPPQQAVPAFSMAQATPQQSIAAQSPTQNSPQFVPQQAVPAQPRSQVPVPQVQPWAQASQQFSTPAQTSVSGQQPLKRVQSSNEAINQFTHMASKTSYKHYAGTFETQSTPYTHYKSPYEATQENKLTGTSAAMMMQFNPNPSPPPKPNGGDQIAHMASQTSYSQYSGTFQKQSTPYTTFTSPYQVAGGKPGSNSWPPRKAPSTSPGTPPPTSEYAHMASQTSYSHYSGTFERQSTPYTTFKSPYQTAGENRTAEPYRDTNSKPANSDPRLPVYAKGPAAPWGLGTPISSGPARGGGFDGSTIPASGGATTSTSGTGWTKTPRPENNKFKTFVNPGEKPFESEVLLLGPNQDKGVSIEWLAKKKATELGMNYAAIKGTGPNGRITLADVDAAASRN